MIGNHPPQYCSPRVDNQSASIIQVESKSAFALAVVMMMLAVTVSFVSLMYSMHAEREARIIEDDTKYIRAYLSARGIHVPANHEEAEER